MATYTSNYAWTKPSGGDPVDIEVLNDNLDNQDSIVHQAFLDLAPVFSTENTYAVKDVVLYDNKVWICHTAVTTAGAWTGSTNWTQTTVGETGGVARYADLPDKPSINGNELSGNKTGAQLGLQNALTFDNVPTEGSNNPVKSGGIYTALENYVDIQANCGFHNSIYRGKNLGTSVTAAQWASISAGTFEDMYVGDYWVINGVTWRIAHFDYWLNTGDTNCTTHHVVIVPDTNLYSAQMNTENVTTGGYYSSKMRGGENYLVNGSSNLYNAKTAIDNAFGSAHILSHRELFTNGVSNGNASGWAWDDSTVDLMSEVMVYGIRAWSVGGKGYEVGIDKEQLALFRLDHSRICNRAYWWLRGVGSASCFVFVNAYGYAAYNDASYSCGVRPAFAIK